MCNNEFFFLTLFCGGKTNRKFSERENKISLKARFLIIAKYCWMKYVREYVNVKIYVNIKLGQNFSQIFLKSPKNYDKVRIHDFLKKSFFFLN